MSPLSAPLPPALSVSLSITADVDALTVVRHVLDGLVEHDDITVPILDDMQIAVGEACANVVTHAYRGRAAGPLDVDVRLTGATLEVVVRDQGPGFETSTQHTGFGMGLAMMGALCDELTVGPRDAAGHAVRMTFDIGAG